MLDVLAGLQAELTRATIDENWKLRVGRQTDLRIKFNAPDLTVRQEGYFQIINLEGHEITIGSNATDEQIGQEIARLRGRPNMSAIDRIREKALKAKGVVPRVIAGVESELDGIIGAEAEIEQQKEAAFAPHKAAIAETKTELDGIKDALSIMSNGAPE